MKLTIHRGSKQIGGCIAEYELDGWKLFVDFGDQLPDSPESEIPLLIEGLNYGDTSKSALLITHYHGDHIGKLAVAVGDEYDYVHTSGHADPHTLEQLFMLMDAEMIIPMHTSNPVKFLEKFSGNDWQIRLIEDGETIDLEKEDYWKKNDTVE